VVSPSGSAVFHRLLQQDYPLFVRGAGSRLTDDAGRDYVDAAGGGAGVACLGHGNTHVIEAVTRQHEALSYVYNLKYTNAQQERLASRLAGHAPLAGSRAYFAQDGAEVNEAAMRLAKQYHADRGEPARTVIITQGFAYYGSTLGAMSLSGLGSSRFPVDEWLPRFERVKPSVCAHCPVGRRPETCDVECAGQYEEVAARVGHERVAAVVIETIVLTGGVIAPPKDYLQRLATWCREIGALLILDEVVTALGRAGRWFACERWGVVPDMITVGKGLGGGYAPISALIVSERVYAVVAATSGHFAHGHSLNGNPVSCAAGNAVLDVIEREDLVARADEFGAVIRDALRDRLARSRVWTTVRAVGMFFGIEFGRDAEHFIDRDLQFAARFERACFEHGVLVFTNQGHRTGFVGDYAIMWPALNMTERDAEEMVERLGRALETAGATLAG
jgi:adenosylmethionine-8-amino-7-oxononanoate aminotransferase